MEYSKVVKDGDKYVKKYDKIIVNNLYRNSYYECSYKNCPRKKIYSMIYRIFKTTYSWKCEEIKQQHKTLNKILPDNVCEMLSNYEKCKTCAKLKNINTNLC